MANPQMKFLLQKRDREKRKRLIVLVRILTILTKLLDRTNRFILLHKVRCVIREYSGRCRLGDTGIVPLHDAIESRLHALVDDETWTQVILCLELYMAHRHSRKQPPSTLKPDAPAFKPYAPAKFMTIPKRRVLPGSEVPV